MDAHSEHDMVMPMVLALAQNAEKHIPLPPVRRGECPTLNRPMRTGDGLLARLRPQDSALSFAQLAALAAAASEFGNGILEITARGSLQVRGLGTETVLPFEEAVFAARIMPLSGTSVETAPLAGIDPDELLDMRALASDLRSAIADEADTLQLAAKLSITLDAGGLLHLRNVSSDLKVTAFRESGGQIHFLVSAGGDLKTSTPLAIVEERQVCETVMRLLRKLSAMGPGARGKDLDRDVLQDYPLRTDPAQIEFPADLPHPVGLHRLSDGSCVLGVALAYCRIEAAGLGRFAQAAIDKGATEVRLAPGHALIVPRLDSKTADALAAEAVKCGFLTERTDPRLQLALCAGSSGCASAFFDTRALADRMIANGSELFDGSCEFHVSGCAKGCAHPAASILTLTGASTGYGLVVNGAASATPSTYIAENEIEIAIRQLNALVRECRRKGETVADCLKRLGARQIVTALQLDGT